MQASTPRYPWTEGDLRDALGERVAPRTAYEWSSGAHPWVFPLDLDGLVVPTESSAEVDQENNAVQRSVVSRRPAETTQLLLQANDLSLDGDASAQICFGGAMDGTVRAVEAGPVTGEVDQLNRADQRITVTGADTAPSSVIQAAGQFNGIAVDGTVIATICGHRDFTGTITDIEVGLLTGELDQFSRVLNRVDHRGKGGAEVEQIVAQENLLDAHGVVLATMKVHKDFAGTLERVDVGMVTADLGQTNFMTQSVSSASGAIMTGQVLEQGSLLQACGHVVLFLDVWSHFTGRISDVEIGLVTGEVEQRNAAEQLTAFRGKAAAADTPSTADQDASQVNLVSASGSVEACVQVEGALGGVIEDVEIGLITADITQANEAGQSATFTGKSGVGGSATQAIDQLNSIEVMGELSVELVVEGDFTGAVRDVEIGLLTGTVDQVNLAGQLANIFGDAAQTQEVEQENRFTIDLIDEVDIDIILEGDFTAVLEGLSIGLVFAEVAQGNFALQQTTGVGARSAAPALPDLSPFMTRSHSFDADGRLNLEVDIVIDAAHALAFSNLEIGIEWVDLVPGVTDRLWA